MTPFAEYTRYDGLGLAALVQRGEVSPAELLEAAIARIEAHNPSLNAVVRKRYEAARAEAAQVDRRAVFAGVPFLVKDLLATLAGEPTAYGNRLLAGMPMPHSSEMVRRWRAAGLVIAGRTNTPEFGLSPYTEPLLYGPTRNPWSAAHSPGGSSGGSAAAVAAGMVPLASGGDGGGSIRIPASCCGLFGFKPSRGTTPTGPEFGELWQGFVVEHVISRSVRDSAAALDATAGADAGAPYAAPARARPFLDEVGADLGRLRVAFTSRPLFGQGAVHADVVTALQEAARLLESLGHHVEEATPPIEPEADALAFVTVLAGETRAEIEQLALLAGRKPRADAGRATGFDRGAAAQPRRAAADACRECTRRRLAARCAGRDQATGGQDLRLHPVHAAVQRHRATGDVDAVALERSRAAGGRALRGAVWRRRDAVPPGGATGAGTALVSPPATGVLSRWHGLARSARHLGCVWRSCRVGEPLEVSRPACASACERVPAPGSWRKRSPPRPTSSGSRRPGCRRGRPRAARPARRRRV